MARPFHSIPGPSEPMLIGSVYRRFKNPLGFFEELSNEFGPMAKFSLFTESFVLVSDPAMIEEVLIEKHASFHKGRALEKARVFLGNSVLVTEENEHRRQRKMLQPAFHRERIARYALSMATIAENWALQRKAGEELDLAVHMNRLTLEVVAATLFGSTVKDEARQIADALGIIVENFTRLLMPFAQFIRLLPTSKNRRIKEAERHMNQAIYKIIRERRDAKSDRGDLLSMLLAAEDAETGQRLTDLEVRDQSMTLFLAGHETTANALNWTWHLLSQDSSDDIRRKLVAEVREVVGNDRIPGLDDVGKLVYTRAVLTEAMRIYPPVWALGRRAVKPVTIGDTEIRVGTILILSQIVTHRSPRYWPEPMAFRPERWTEPWPADRHKFAYLPFGAGPRGCMGEAFAWTEALLVLACTARRWGFRYSGTEQAVPLPTFTLRPQNGMKMRVLANAA